MSVRLIVAVTDKDWYDHLRMIPHLDEVNFWSPSPKNFRALSPGELFLFKLHSPHDFIVGGGVFAHANTSPCSLAWEAFGEKNGASSFRDMRTRIARYRRLPQDSREDFPIGCRILTSPFFLPPSQWIPVPSSWKRNIVAFKGYSTAEPDGRFLWDAVQSAAISQPPTDRVKEDQARFGEPCAVRPRLGQGAFRLLVTDSYDRRCAVTRESTLPVLDAAHIIPYSDGGTHDPSNGILLRRDLHSLFDRGYVTVTTDLRFEVSRRIREDYENGRDYYALHGREVAVPPSPSLRPDPAGLRWHNDRFLV